MEMRLDRNLLENVVPFLVVAEYLSFTRAAAVLGLTPTAVSKSIRHLEQRHGVVLFQRTTRSVALTEAGADLFQRLKVATEEMDQAFSILHGHRDVPRGTLRLTLTRHAMAQVVEPILEEYCRLCPEVTLELSLNEGTVDLVSGNYDAGIRLGESIEKDMIAVRLTPEIEWSVAGSPEYFARRAIPRYPEDLTEHEAILYRFVTSGSIHRWEFVRGKREYTVEMKGRVIVNDRLALVSLARRGLGLAYVADAAARADFASGALISVLRDFIPTDAGLYLYFPARTQSQPKLRAFIDLVTKHASRARA
jgi:DNA-binding transcriptional LysR family regulator